MQLYLFCSFFKTIWLTSTWVPKMVIYVDDIIITKSLWL